MTIATVDAFQGMEHEVIIVSTVRASSSAGQAVETATLRGVATSHSQLAMWPVLASGCSPHSRGSTKPLGLLSACLVPL